MALSHGKSIWYYLMGNLFGIISWKIYLALSHSWEYERSLPSDEYMEINITYIIAEGISTVFHLYVFMAICVTVDSIV